MSARQRPSQGRRQSSDRDSSRRRALLGYWPLAAGLLAALGLLFSHAWTMNVTWVSKSRQPLPASLSSNSKWGGQDAAQAERPPRVFDDTDCYYWIRYAREMARTGAFRIHYTDADNVPYGREVHWSSAFTWWLVFCGTIQHLLTGDDMDNAIADGAVWADPLLLAILLTLLAVTVGRCRSPAAGGTLAFMLASLFSIEWDFCYGRPDHHGLHDFAFLCMISSLLLGGGAWTRRRGRESDIAAAWLPTYQIARRWFIASALFGGVGLWTGATEFAIIFVAVGMGALFSGLLFQKSASPAAEFQPTLWRLWGRIGALTSLFFYLLEYFPNHIGMRLEVNHPVFALAWLCGGEIIAGLCEWQKAKQSWPIRNKLILGACLLGALLPAILVLLGPEHWHSLRDSYMRRAHDYIAEFRSFSSRSNGKASMLAALFATFGLLPLLAPIAMVGLFLRRLSPPVRSQIILALMPVLMLGVWAWMQVRWSGLFSASLVALSLGLLPALRELTSTLSWGTPLRLGVAFLIIVPGGAHFLTDITNTSLSLDAPPEEMLATSLAERDIALNFKRLSALGEIRVMADPSSAAALHYFGGISAVGSLYWENIPGIHDTADFFADFSDIDARRIARERGITHVVVQADPGLAWQMLWTKIGSRDPKEVERTLAYRLASPISDIPNWLDPLPFYGSPIATKMGIRIFKVNREALAAKP